MRYQNLIFIPIFNQTVKMKVLVALLGLVLICSANAQSINNISAKDFNSIKINGRKLKQIVDTKGDLLKTQNLMGQTNNIEVYEELEGMEEYTFYYPGFVLSFSNMVERGRLVRISIDSLDPTITIDSVNYKVGGLSTSLSEYHINLRKGGGTSYVFSPDDDETIYFTVDFDNKTMVISKMTYFVLD